MQQQEGVTLGSPVIRLDVPARENKSGMMVFLSVSVFVSVLPASPPFSFPEQYPVGHKRGELILPLRNHCLVPAPMMLLQLPLIISTSIVRVHWTAHGYIIDTDSAHKDVLFRVGVRLPLQHLSASIDTLLLLFLFAARDLVLLEG